MPHLRLTSDSECTALRQYVQKVQYDLGCSCLITVTTVQNDKTKLDIKFTTKQGNELKRE